LSLPETHKNISSRKTRLGDTASELTFEIRHERLGSRSEGVDYHLPIRRTCDLDPPIFQSRSRRRTTPSDILPDLLRGLQKVQVFPTVQLGLDLVPVGEELFSDRVEGSVERSKEFQGLRSEDLGSSFARRRFGCGR
jgi:hypothetical protein